MSEHKSDSDSENMMAFDYEPIEYEQLSSAQQENYNYQKVCAVLADYGFSTIRLTDDWKGADFVAQHADSNTFLKVQLKGGLTFAKKYIGKDLCIAFPEGGDWYLVPHDELLEEIIEKLGIIKCTKAWEENGRYYIGNLSKKQRRIAEPYRIQPIAEGTGAEMVEEN